MDSNNQVSNKRKRVHLGIAEKLELIQKLESGVSVTRVCEEYGVKKQTMSDIRKSKDKLKEFAEKFNVEKNKNRKGVVRTRKHMKVPQSKELEEAVFKWYVQQRSVYVKVPGIEIKAVADKLARHMGLDFKASDGWLWRFRNRHGLCNKFTHCTPGSVDASAVDPFQLKLKELIKTEDLHLSQLYNADETGLFWRSLPRNTLATKTEDSTSEKKISDDKISALLGCNATGTHRLKPVIVGRSAQPRCLKDCMQELPVIYHYSQNSRFTRAIFEDWFFKHFIPEVRIFQENVLQLHPEDVKAILLLDNSHAHPHLDKLVSADGKIRAVFLPPNRPPIQPMGQGVIKTCKRYYQRKYLDEVLIALEDEEDLEDNRRILRTFNNINRYKLKSAIYNFASSWRDVKMNTLSNAWKKLLLGEDFECDFLGFEPEDFHQVLLCAGEKDVTIEDVKNWLEENDADHGYQMLSTDELAEAVVTDKEAAGDKSFDDDDEEEVVRPKMSAVRESLDILISYVDGTDNRDIQAYYGHLRTLRELIIRDQHQQGKELKLDSIHCTSKNICTPDPELVEQPISEINCIKIEELS